MTYTDTAWNLIGYDGPVKVKGGRVEYDAVIYNDSTPGTQVRLARLVPVGNRMRQINRYVHPDTLLEVPVMPKNLGGN